MKLEYVYYIAALLDGEGCFRYVDTPKIVLKVTDIDIVQRFLDYSKIDKIPRIIKSINPKHKDAYYVAILGHVAIQWMMTIYPLMCKRRQVKIKEIISTWKTANLDNAKKIYCHKGHILAGKNLHFDPMTGSRRCKKCRLWNQRARTIKVVLSA